MRMPFHPLASQMKLGAAAHATSRTLCAEKRQVSVAVLPTGRIDACPPSLLAMMATVESERSARAIREGPDADRNDIGCGSRLLPAAMHPLVTVPPTVT